MKKLFIVLAIGAFAACNGGASDAPAVDSTAAPVVDTTVAPAVDSTVAADSTAVVADSTKK